MPNQNINRKLCLLVSFLLAGDNCHSAGYSVCLRKSQNSVIDSLELELEQSHDSRKRIEILTKLSKSYQPVDLEKATENAFSALNLSNNTEIGDFKAEIYGCLGDIAVMQDSIELARNYYLTSLALFEESNDAAGLAGVTLVLGNIAYVQNNLPDAMVFYQRALKYAEEAGYHTWIDNLYSNIGNLSLEAGNYNEAQELFIAALEKAIDQSDTVVITNAYSNLGLTNIQIGDTARAREYLIKSQELAIKTQNASQIAQNTLSLAILERAQKNHEKALAYLRQSRPTWLRMTLLTPDPKGFCTIRNLCEFG